MACWNCLTPRTRIPRWARTTLCGTALVALLAAGPGQLGAQEGPPAPTLGKTVNASLVSGTVKTKCKGDKRFKRLLGTSVIRVGCVVDTRRGRVSITSARNRRGATQSGVFYDGRFKVKQKKRKNAVTVLALNGNLNCGQASAARKRKRGRRLWGNSKGRFRTKASYGAATVRGTKWLVEDRCDGTTFVKVTRGSVRFRDFVLQRTVTVRSGETYTASGFLGGG